MAEIKMDDLKPNSNKYKELQEVPAPEKRVKKPVTTNVISREKRVRSKLIDALIGEEIGSVKDYLLYDVFIPAVKNTIVDSITNAAEMIFGVNPRGQRRRESNYVSYASYYKSGNRNNRRNDYDDRNSRYDYRDIIFRSRVEADEVLSTLRELVEDYKAASVSDLYDLVGITGDFQDHKWGWYDLDLARVTRGRDGYFIDFPRIRPID